MSKIERYSGILRNGCSDYVLAAEFDLLEARLAKYEDADGKALKGDSIIDSMRRNGLSIDGDNAYKRDLCDSIVGALAFGKQRSTPPPTGHWLEQFYDIGLAEANERDATAPNPADHIRDAAKMVDHSEDVLGMVGQRARDSAELRRLCVERDGLKADLKASDQALIESRANDTASVALVDELRAELELHRMECARLESINKQHFKTLARVHCMYGKRLLDLTGRAQSVLVPDEEFVKYFDELKRLKAELATLKAGAGEPIGEIDEGDDGVFVELLADRTFRLGQKVYAAPQPAPDVIGLASALELIAHKLESARVWSGTGWGEPWASASTQQKCMSAAREALAKFEKG